MSDNWVKELKKNQVECNDTIWYNTNGLKYDLRK